MDFAKKSEAKEFIIGTENSIVQHLQFACPDKQFYALSKDCVCHNMKLTTLADVYNCVAGIGGEDKADYEPEIRDGVMGPTAASTRCWQRLTPRLPPPLSAVTTL